MNTKFSRVDKPKGKFAQSNINLVYRGNASETQSKPTLRSGGLQLVGKLQGTRRNPPPPPWVPSIKAEMGGQDTKINIVPPGGSGWGTGTSNSAILENSPKSDTKVTLTASSALEGASESSGKDSDDSKRSNYAESFQSTLVKPPQKPFFALRSSKSISGKPANDGSPDIGRTLTGKAAGPTIPFYQRPTASSSSNSVTPKDPELAEPNIDEKPLETKAVSNEIAPPRTGWAAVTTEEPDFQERINFSDGEEDASNAPMVEVSNELPKTSIVSVTSWASSSIQPQAPAQVSYPRAAWDQPSCFNPVSPMQHTFNASFCGPNEGIFAEPSIPGARPDVLPSREVALLSEQLQRTSFTTSEAQVQAQREERTLAFKSAVNRAQMARKKRSDAEVMEPKRKDQSIDSTKSTLTDVSVFSQSIMQSGPAAIAGTPTFSMHGPVNHSPQHHTMEPSNSKGGHVQGLQPDRPIEGSVHSYGNTVGESSVVNHLPFQSAKPHIPQHPPSSPTLEKRMESDSNKELVVSSLTRTVAINSRPLQISAHTEGSRTAFTPPAQSTIEAFPQQNSHPQPVQQQPHITPLMEVNLSGKWSEKDFDTFPPPVSSRDNYARFKSSRGCSKGINDERSGVHRYATYNSSGRQNRGPPQRGAMKRSARRALEMDDDRTDDHPVDEPVVGECGEERQGDLRRQRRDDIGSGTFPRQQRVRGSNRMSKSNHGTPHDYDECKQQNCDFDRQQTCCSYNQRDRWKTGGGGCKNVRQGDRVIEKTSSAILVSGRGRKNFPRGGPGDRRYTGHEDASKPRGHHPNQRKTDENAETANATPHNDVDEVDTNVVSDSEQGTTTLQLTGSDPQHFHSQRPQRGGSNSGRARRGQHGGSQRQPQRRGRTDRANTRRQNNRRHPDEDDDHDFKGGPSNTNGTSTAVATTTTTSGDSNTGKGEGRPNTESNGSTTSSGQQPSGTVDAVQSCGTNIFAPAAKSRSHAHSITLASDVEVWETASEGFSSSLLGTSPGCSFADCTSASPAAGIAKADDHKDLVAADGDDDYEEGGYSHAPKRIAQRRSTPKITGKIVPLMSINAEAPPSYCDNPSFLDSPLPTVKSSSNDTAPGGSTAEVKDAESLPGSVSLSSEDGFMEVRSKSSRKQQKARMQQKSQKSSVSSDERSSAVKTKNRDLVKSRGQAFVLSKTDQKPSKPSKSDESPAKDKQRSASTTVTATSANSSQTSSKLPESAAKKLSNSTVLQPTNAWLKPLQETINEKAAAAAAALAAQNNTKSKTASSDAAASSSKASASTTVSSYAWSVVVGSRTTATSTSCTPSENTPVSLMAKTSEKVASKPMQNAASDHPSTLTVAGTPQPLTMPAEFESSVIPQSRQSKLEEKTSQDEGVTQLSDPSGVSAPNTSAVAATSANVCKVRPQKQPTNAVITSSSTAPAAHTSKPELTSFPMSTTFSTPGNTVLINTSQLRRPIGDVGDWLGKTPGVYTSNSSSVFFDAYGSKKLETTPESSLGLTPAATAAAAVYLQQHQQQPFRQTLHPLQQQQPMMGFGLPDLTMRHQNNRMSGTCSQNGMGTDSYFTVPPFGAGNAGQAGAQQPPRSLYPPAPPAQQRGFPSWQHQQHHSQQEAAVMAAAVAGAVAPQAAALWSSNYTPSPPPPHHHPSYVGVIGADRPSSTSSVSITSRLQSSNAGASLYGSGSIRGGSGAAPGVGGPPFAQPAPPPQPPPQAASIPPPSGLYASSPTHPTPPPPLPFDPNFAYTSGGLANSTSVFSHHSGAAGGPALLAAPHRQSASARSLGDHPHTSHPPVFINASHTPFPAAPAAISVHGLAGPPTASMTTPGLHF
ncbi:Protein PRRC2C [Taenia solium]|eukprot:TsM_001237400 transcript=TsM_001237400 gene=TsM_001237400